VELYQVANERDVKDLEDLADKVSYEEEIPLCHLFAIHSHSHWAFWICLIVTRIYPLLRGECEQDGAGDKGSKK
jgi:hypothetical protein